MSEYRPLSSSNIDIFSDELTISLSKAVNKFDDLITMGNFNIDITEKIVQDLINWKSYVITFHLTNLIKSEIRQ